MIQTHSAPLFESQLPRTANSASTNSASASASASAANTAPAPKPDAKDQKGADATAKDDGVIPPPPPPESFTTSVLAWVKGVCDKAQAIHKVQVLTLDDIAHPPSNEEVYLSILSMWKYGVPFYLDKFGVVPDGWHDAKEGPTEAVVECRKQLEKLRATKLADILKNHKAALDPKCAVFIEYVVAVEPAMTILQLVQRLGGMENLLVSPQGPKKFATATAYHDHFLKFYHDVLVGGKVEGKESMTDCLGVLHEKTKNTRLLQTSIDAIHKLYPK